MRRVKISQYEFALKMQGGGRREREDTFQLELFFCTCTYMQITPITVSFCCTKLCYGIRLSNNLSLPGFRVSAIPIRYLSKQGMPRKLGILIFSLAALY